MAWRWVFWLVLVRLAVCSVAGEFFVISGPTSEVRENDISTNNRVGQGVKTMYCVTDELSGALTWNTNLEWKKSEFKNFHKVSKPEVFRNESLVYPADDSLDCWMNNTHKCSTAWTRDKNWKYVTSITNPMAPLFDKRLEDLKEFKMTDRFEFVIHVPIEGSQAVSIRGDVKVEFRFCNQDNVHSYCVSIILESQKNTPSRIIKCRNNNCNTIGSFGRSVSLSPTEWNTFVIKWTFGSELSLSIYDSVGSVFDDLKFNQTNDFVSSHKLATGEEAYFFFVKGADSMLMKFHTYGYSRTTRSTSELLSPEITTSSTDRNICIEMSISLCKTCILTVDIVDRNNSSRVIDIGKTFKADKTQNNAYDLPMWKNVRISKTLSESSQQLIKLKIKTLSTPSNSTDRFWAVSNVRRCNAGAVKVIRIKAYQDFESDYFWPSITCQKISIDGTSSIIESTDFERTTQKTGRQRCEEHNIGPSCLVSCSKLFPKYKDCSKLLDCDKNGCSCASGFKWPTCERCPDSTYGFECEKCGKCAHRSCSFATGKCRDGCENPDDRIFLPPYCKTGVGLPPAPKVELINSTCVRVFLKVEKKYGMVPIKVNFEIWANSTKPAFTSEPTWGNVTTASIDTFFERLTPGTHYRVRGVFQVENKAMRGEWTNLTTSCIESIALNFVVSSDKTTITIDNRVDVHINDSCPYTWYRVQLINVDEKKVLFNDSTFFPKAFTDLEYFTTYNIIISSGKEIANKQIRTSEGAPASVRDLKISSESENKIHVSWKPPLKPNGIIVNYTVEIEPIKSYGCSDDEAPDEAIRTQTIPNTHTDEFSHTIHGLRPYKKYRVTIYASTGKQQGEKAMLEHSTKALEIPTEVYSNLRVNYVTKDESRAELLEWDSPTDCSTITGPIKASKLYFKDLNRNFTVEKLHHFRLQKSIFDSNKFYEVYLYVLRSPRDRENETAYISLNFTLIARAPPPVRNFEVIEVDPYNRTTTLRWDPPVPPLHGTLDHYSIAYCYKMSNHCDTNNNTIVLPEAFCGLWSFSQNSLCSTIYLPDADYHTIMIKAHNANVTEGSEPVFVPLITTELVPLPPNNLSVIIDEPHFSASVSWTHPWISGGKIVKFDVVTQLIGSDLRLKPWKHKITELNIETSGYNSIYSMDLQLFPASSFLVSVRAVTETGNFGQEAKKNISLGYYVDVQSKCLKAKINEDLIYITIPETMYDVEDSKMVIIVQGPKYCDEDSHENEEAYLYIDKQSNSDYKYAWIAAVLTEPISYENKDFEIGDGQIKGNYKNHALCDKEYYQVHLIHVCDSNKKKTNRSSNSAKNSSDEKKILQSFRTGPLYVDSFLKKCVMWIVPLILITLFIFVLLLIACRKKFLGRIGRNKPKSDLPENVPLSNDYCNKGKTNDLENGIKETKNLQNNKLIIPDKKSTYSMPVRVEDFEKYFESAYKSGSLETEYMSLIRGPIKPCAYGSEPEIKPKNRYANLFPYDETRVVLEKVINEPHSDYINANFIKGYEEKEKAYIATQGPKPRTVLDFWRMVLQEEVEIICMMSNLIENEKIKCEQYWPAKVGTTVLYGKISVSFISEEIHSDYTYRKFQIFCENKKAQMVRHLHYTAWPDHGVPSNSRSIVSFLKELHRHAPVPREPEAPPIVVHCSAGVGRTGTLIVLDMAICRAFSENVIDVHANVLSARNDRLNMVDNAEQYLLIHLVLVEYFNVQDTCLICDDDLPASIAEARKNSIAYYERILNTDWWNGILGSSQPPEKPLSTKNIRKHRFPETAVSINRLYLKRSNNADEDSDYVAASSVTGVFKDCRYITTQLPLPSTSADFWRMLSEENVEYVLVLQLPDLQDSTYCELVPESKEFGNAKYIKIIEQEGSKIDLQYYLKEEVVIIDSSEQPEKNQSVKLISYKNWPNLSFPSAQDLVKLWKVIEDLPKNNKSPIVVVCRDGMTACGLWLTAVYLLKRIQIDKECDVPLDVRAIGKCRRDYVKTPEHLEYLYDVALAWHEENKKSTK